MEQNFELRLGYVSALCTNLLDEQKESQLSLLRRLFGDLIVIREEHLPDDIAIYDNDESCHIHAVERNGQLYAGDQNISYIIGCLIGMAKSNREKGRKTASLIQKRAAREIMNDKTIILKLQKIVQDHLALLDEDQLIELDQRVGDFIIACAEDRSEMRAEEKLDEQFAMDDDVYDGIMTNAMYALLLGEKEDLANAYLWLLLGALLRNEAWRLVSTFDASFTARFYIPSQDGTLLDKLHQMLDPDDYYSIYDGDDLDRRFPGIMFYCDKCDSELNRQEGFDDHLEEWKCTSCGHVNRICMEEIYETEEDARNGVNPINPDDFRTAVEDRRRELEDPAEAMKHAKLFKFKTE